MFLNVLDMDEKRAFAELAAKMVEADGIVIGREAATLAALKAEMGIAETDGNDRTIGDLAGVFKSKRTKTAALLELVGLGYSDTNFNVGEQSLVTSIAQEMGLGAEDVAQIEGWVKEHVDLVRRALVLMRD
jgi:hypothetical protein